MDDEPKWPEMTPCIISNPRESITSCNHIHYLCDELLKEILLRLPNCKSVIQIKCVCRRWDALTAHPCFSVDFIRFKLENGVNLNNHHETFAMIIRYEPDRFRMLWQKTKYQMFFRPSVFQLEDSTFSPFHCLKDEVAPCSVLVASFQDLLLYSRQGNGKCDYYISNIQTRDSIMLPSAPSYCTKQPHLVGFICDPFYSSGREISVNVAYNYSVVICCTPQRSTKICAHIFSSHCGNQWCDKVLALPEKCEIGQPCSALFFSFCFDGKLHYTCSKGFFGFDHNSIGSQDEIMCHLVKWPVGIILGYQTVSVSQGCLHVSAYVYDTSTLNVWVLEDYQAGNWMLKHSVTLNEWVPRHPFITEKLIKFRGHQGKLRIQGLVRVLGFHPSNSDVIYVLVPGYIFLCNLSTKDVELACRIPVAIAKKYNHYLSLFYSFPIIFQTWPTPLLPVAQGLKVEANMTRAFALKLKVASMLKKPFRRIKHW